MTHPNAAATSRWYRPLLLAIAAGLFLGSGLAKADELVWSCNTFGSGIFTHASVYGINASATCPGSADSGGGLRVGTAGNTVAAGQQASWEARAPSGLIIVGAAIPTDQLSSNGINDGQQYGGGFYWAGGGAQTQDLETTAAFPNLWSSYFGWHVICGANPCRSNYNWLSVSEIALQVRETVGPSLVSPDGLWRASGWLRGDWAVRFYGDSPSGVCDLSATLDGQTVSASSSIANPGVWHQCDAAAALATVRTGNYGQGGVPLTLNAFDAAGMTGSVTRTVYLDNTPPVVALSGPTDAPTTAGVQYVNATAATSGPSGIAGIGCSLDGGPAQWYTGRSARVPVQGIGVHRVMCWSANNAHDSSGNLGTSAGVGWTLSIRQPSVSALSFSHVVDALRCGRTRERVRIPAHWVTVEFHGQQLHVRLPAETRTITVVHCHPVLVRRRVRSHGHWRVERVVLLPHTVQSSSRRVGYGAATTVSGWVGTSQGNALARQPVEVIAAPDNGGAGFREIAAATTAGDGSWSAAVPGGPSRILEAIYPGTALTEPSESAPARVVVPASVRLSITPRHAHWGGTIMISGRLRGGYVPPAGEVLFVRLEYHGKQIEVAHVRTSGDGRFRTSYTFLGGTGTAAYPFWVTSVPESDYPFAAGSSRKISVTVGP